MSVYTIHKVFTSSIQRTPRVLDLAEGFGLGLSDKQFVVFNNLELEVRRGDVVYITGQSGAGKSLLLNDLARQMSEQGKSVANLEAIVLEDKPVIDQLGETIGQATELLAKAGISDAYIYLRKPSELSGGQQYRLKLAKIMESGADVWVADEFGAVLDRVTAKIIAFNMQKVARAHGKTLIVATTHEDLREELGPDLYVNKRFREKVQIEAKPCT